MSDAEAASRCFDDVAATFARDRRVAQPAATRSSFGSNGLRVDGKIFAMLVRGALVVKLPRARVEALIESGVGQPFRAGGERVMREWVTIERCDFDEWRSLAREARAFVGGAAAKRAPLTRRTR